MNKKSTIVKISLLLSFILLLGGCIAENNLAIERENKVERENSDIVVNLPGPAELIQGDTGFLNGVNMALEEINQEGLLQGRKIRVEIKDDQGSFIEGMTVAQNIASDLDVVAVIGHWHSEITLPAAAIYEKAGVLMFSPIVSNAQLTNKGYKYVFQNIAGDEEIAKKMVTYAKEQGYKKLAIYYEDNSYGRELADAIENAAGEINLSIIDRVSTFANGKEKARALAKWQALDCQGVLVAVSVAQAVETIRNVKAYNSAMPVIGSDSLDVADLAGQLGVNAEGVAMVSLYNPSKKNTESEIFFQKYKNKFGQEPNIWAIQGYDSLKLLAFAIEQAGSAAPSKIAEVLRNLKEWQGVVDKVGFDQQGRQTGRQIFIKTFQNGQFEYVVEK
ncbi:MAG: ABC transporter substrate-binding protein [Eubacteriales bacterium]